MPKATWKTMTLILVMSMVMSAMVALPLNSMGATTDNDLQSTIWYVNGTTYRQSPAGGIAGITVTLKNATVDLSQVTLADGKFSFMPVDGRRNYTLTFEADAWRHGPEYIKLGDFNDTTHVAIMDVIMTEREKITGIVEDLDTKAGIPNVNITITESDDDIWYAMTGPDGSFSKYLDAAGNNVELVFKKEGYYGNSTMESLTLSQEKDIGTIYMEKITPTPEEKVFGYVDSTTQPKLGGVWVEVSEDGVRWIGNETEYTAGYYEIMSYSGRLMIRATEDNHETYEGWIDVPIQNSFDITLTPLPFKNCTVNGTVTGLVSGLPIENAVVALYDNAGSYVDQTITNPNGEYGIEYYGTVAPLATFTLVVSEASHFTDTSNQIDYQNNYTGANPVDVVLERFAQDKTLEGVVKSSETNEPLASATVTVYNSSKLYENRSITSGVGYFEFKIFDDAFMILVEAVGFQSELIAIADVDTYQQITLDPEMKKDIVRTEFEFIDWTNISVTVNRTIYVDNVTIRANADRDWGMGELGITPNNWNLDAAEITAWTNHLVDKGLDQKGTSELLTVDDHYYELNETVPFEVTIVSALGGITGSTSMIYINKSYNYDLVGTLEDETASVYSLILNATYDSSTEDYIYDIIVPLAPTKYEMTANMTETINVDVSGYNEPITVNPKELASEDTETVTMTIEMSMNGTAKAKVTDGLHYVLNNTFDNYTVIVRMGSTAGVNTTVAFSAMDSTDQIGEIGNANFTWNFGDGIMGYGIAVTHNYTSVGQKTVNLTVTETGGNVTYRDITIKVDSQAPTAGISVDTSDVTNMTLNGTTLTVNEDLPLTFSGIKFTDAEGVTSGGTASGDNLAAGDGEGIIEKWYWSWGQEGVSNETITKEGSNNITHTYVTPGTYTLLMNVTDVVDHVSTDATWTMKVLDITPPEPTFDMTNSTGAVATEATENETYTFNASLTYDNFEELDNMTFKWDFDSDGTIDATGLTADHMFQTVGDSNVTLIANDTAGNVKNYTRPVYVSIGQRPDILMKYGSMVFGSETGRVGKALTISVNLTNTGTVNATDITVTFYIRNADGDDITIGTASTALLAVEGNYTATVTWKPSKKGEYSIWAEASCAGEHSSQHWDNSVIDFDIQKITINEAGWVVPAIILVVIVVIVAVFFGMRYFMDTRMTAEDKSGKRKKK